MCFLWGTDWTHILFIRNSFFNCSCCNMSHVSRDMICCAKPRLLEALYIHTYTHTNVTCQTVNSTYPQRTGLFDNWLCRMPTCKTININYITTGYDRPVLSSERSSHIDKTPSDSNKKSCLGPQMKASHQDWLANWPLVVTWLWLTL
jgi:hypothetical protein